MSWAWIGFAVLAGAVLYAGYKVVTDPLITHAALYLAVVLAGVAGFFLMLQSEFLAVVQVLVYVGAVMTVIIFAIMLSDLPSIRGEREPGLVARIVSERFGAVPFLVAAGVLLLVLVGYGSAAWVSTSAGAAGAEHPIVGATGQGTTGVIGRALFTTYLVPFEVASLLLLAALVGAIVLTRQEVAARVRELPRANAGGARAGGEGTASDEGAPAGAPSRAGAGSAADAAGGER